MPNPPFWPVRLVAAVFLGLLLLPFAVEGLIEAVAVVPPWLGLVVYLLSMAPTGAFGPLVLRRVFQPAAVAWTCYVIVWPLAVVYGTWSASDNFLGPWMWRFSLFIHLLMAGIAAATVAVAVSRSRPQRAKPRHELAQVVADLQARP